MTFEEFWARYPRKIAKGNARKAYEKALKLASHDEIMSGLEQFVKAAPWDDDIRFCPHPATWLNGERWEDDFGEPERDPVRDMTFEERRQHSQKIIQQAQDEGRYPRMVK